MFERIDRIRRYGITSDMLKIIAVVAMVIDHIAYYFKFFIPDDFISFMEYGVGRISMPIFVFLLVQGFFNTKNFKKYLIRMTCFGIITQLLLVGCAYINKNMFPEYTTNIYNFLNILISFALTLVLLKVIHEPILIKKYDIKINIVIKIVIGVILLNVYSIIPIDYGITVPLLAIMFYGIERLRITILISKNNVNLSFKGLVYKSIDEDTIKNIYGVLILVAILICVMFSGVYYTALFAVIPLYLYNGDRKKAYYKYKYAYYIFFAVHHSILYLSAMYVYNNIML